MRPDAPGRSAPAQLDSTTLTVSLLGDCDDSDANDTRWQRPKLAAGDAFGRFIVQHELGQGAASVVLAAYDPKLDRNVALKLLRRRGDARDERLLREGRALARVSHPNVVTVYEVGDVDGQLYIALELVTGTTARQWAAAQQRSWREVRDVYVAVARGLSALHRAGLVHRDVKPDNIVVANNGAARLVDLGLVGAGVGAGTQAYMAPELVRGELGTPASDQYALAAALADSLGGRDAIHDPDRLAVPRRIRAALVRALATEPAARFASIDALSAALADGRRSQLIAAVGGAAVASAAVVAVLTLSGTSSSRATCDVASPWTAPVRAQVSARFAASSRAHARSTFERIDRHLADAATAWSRARSATCRAHHVDNTLSAEAFDRRIDCLGRHRKALDATFDQLLHGGAKVIDRAIELVAAIPRIDECSNDTGLATQMPLPLDPALRAQIETIEVDLAAALAADRAGDPTTALATADRALVAARSTDHAPLVARAAYRAAMLVEATGDRARAQTLVDEAIRTAADARLDSIEAGAWVLRLYLRGLTPGITETELMTDQRASAAAVERADDPLVTARYTNILGLLKRDRGDLHGALAEHQRSHAILLEAAPKGHEIARSYSNIAHVLLRLGDRQAAKRAATEAVARDLELYGPDHPRYANSLGTLQACESALGEHAAAAAHAEQAVRIHVASYGEHGESSMIAFQNAADALAGAKRPAEAQAYARRAHGAAIALFGADSPEAVHVEFTLATLLGHDAPTSIEAETFGRATLERARRILGARHLVTAAMAINLGRAALGRDDCAAAEAYAREGLAAMPSPVDPAHARGAQADLEAALACRAKQRGRSVARRRKP